MTEKGYKDGLVSRVRNTNSGKKYVVSTAQEIERDYWTTTIFPQFCLVFCPTPGEKIGRAQNEKSKGHFFMAKRAERVTARLASLVGVSLKECSNFVEENTA